MIQFKGMATFKCKQCGHKFKAFDTEGGFIAGPNPPACPECGSFDTHKASFFSRFGLFTLLLIITMAFNQFALNRHPTVASLSQKVGIGSELLFIKPSKNAIEYSHVFGGK